MQGDLSVHDSVRPSSRGAGLRARGIARAAHSLTIGLLWSSTQQPSPALAGTLTTFRVDSTGVHSITTTALPPPRLAALSAVRGCAAPLGAWPQPKIPPTDKIHPLLRRWIADSAATTNVQVMVAFRDPFKLPVFPEPRTSEPRTSPFNRAAIARADSIVRSIRAARESLYNAEKHDLDKVYGGRSIRDYWITQALLVELPLARVRALAQRADVVSISPNHSGEPPPSCTLPTGVQRDDTPRTARDAMKSDTFGGAAFAHEWFCLLDTGLDSLHIAFKDPGNPGMIHPRLSLILDLVHPDWPGNDIDPDGHGTSSAAIMVGFAQPNDCERGVSGGLLDSFDVYSTSLCPAGCSGVCLVRSAVLEGFQMARGGLLDAVTVAEMQAWGPPDGDISNAADQVFNTGGVVVAAQGNFYGCASCSDVPVCIGDCRVKSPANAHYVISAGGWDIKTLLPLFGGIPVPISMSCGPAADGRVKPDVLAPTGTYVAGAHSPTDFHPFGGTSGATPYAAGAVALIHHFLSASPNLVDHEPGMTYAWLIASGRDTWTRQASGLAQTSFAPSRGAGPIELPDFNLAWIGRVDLPPGSTQTISIPLSGTSINRLEAALWWPDPRNPGTALFGHSRIDLELALPGHPAAAASREINGVFQRATAPIAAADRVSWNFNVIGTAIPWWLPRQAVYYVVLGRP